MLVCNLISHFAQTAGKVVHPQYYGGCFFENRSTRCSPLLLLLLFFIRICLHHLLLFRFLSSGPTVDRHADRRSPLHVLAAAGLRHLPDVSAPRVSSFPYLLAAGRVVNQIGNAVTARVDHFPVAILFILGPVRPFQMDHILLLLRRL